MCNIKIKGTIKKGYNASSKWMPKYIDWLFPGTLNVELQEDKPEIKYFKSIDTEFNYPVKIAKCKINNELAYIILTPLGPKSNIGGLPRFVEISATFNIREKFNLKDGDSVIIQFYEN